ncbi:MAG TPA: DUF5752 family protein [Candidatus Binataceae bacterium]|nr:DUF5752 family protein [Candidatus Binataceae bacterium]
MAAVQHSADQFEFRSLLNMTLLTGLRARDLAELVHHMRTVPGAVIYHHTHHFLVQHQYLSPEPPNDFAYWVSNILLEERLGEELAAVDVLRFQTVRDLRNALVQVIQGFLDRSSNLRAAPPGEEFHFMQSVSYVMPTAVRASSMKEFREGLERVSLSSIAYHMFDARLRLEKGDNDFSRWLEQSLGENRLADALRKVDPYTFTQDGLRRRLLSLVDQRLQEE